MVVVAVCGGGGGWELSRSVSAAVAAVDGDAETCNKAKRNGVSALEEDEEA